MSRLFSNTLSDLQPYVPGEQPAEAVNLKLNTNENPYGPSPKAIEAIKQAAGNNLRLYPDYSGSKLRQAVADLHGINANQVFLGNGSDEVLAHIYKGLFQRDGVLLVPDISYSFYSTYSAMYGIKQKQIPLAPDLSINVTDFTANQNEPVAGVIFANPNAPTGLALGLDQIAAIAKAHPDSAVVVDEAYVDFGAESAVSLLDQFDNLVIVHTLSKSRALAGLRVGFAMASVSIVNALNKVKDSFNSYPLDSLALAGACASIMDHEYFLEKRDAVIKAREYLSGSLKDLGFTVLPSATNFVFASHPNHDASKISQGLRGQGILVRHFNNSRITQFLRITVGTLPECERLCNTLKDILNN